MKGCEIEMVRLEAGRRKLEVLLGYGEMVVSRLYLTDKFKYSFSLLDWKPGEGGWK
ncbi:MULTISPECIES: hypothetical protein [Chryseobacterium]|uniref:hypothetical protein n=1 Tax=Chryseobacterium TaxID=59732 RepID=UPI000A8F00D6|nr:MULTISPECIES: hypothetical protein [Chryseobacterium]